MPDDKTIRQPLDGKRIDINDPNEVRNWTDILDCTPEELKDAVKAVGTSADAVKDHLEDK
ncbi:DUF3606 domain-containing protein [Pseudobacteroides cellulosolvens]|uniref:DUF3606 domain-containing protein n=1 Tax=Pseudobacteroides cellulosolvens ATCC 35603 = DSM 2933 TaxID=398512 RepID=A0A0L6JKV5_9FIRM|nr:DUF3606 domain-containing protein [Pseudobacteroides cellulosolvens]KNY26343.1 Protein of unknown function DUF3606 [Pseudobacteroides cellulosolvens ATCC 35603 = DSM 2933]